jgi:hypothetical protein
VTENVIVVVGEPLTGVTDGLTRFTGGAARAGTTAAARTSASAAIPDPAVRNAGPDLS